jgi:polyisoprenoid-binding protein YceI
MIYICFLNLKIMSTTWNIDASHSEIGFKVRHLMISNVKGSFGKYNAVVTSDDEHFETVHVKFDAESASITTGNEQRDGHLLSQEFFDVENFPSVSYESTGVSKKDEGHFIVDGNLTMRGVTKPVELKVTITGMAKDPWGQDKLAFEASAKINRTEFGLVWNSALEGGGVLLSDDVYLIAEVQFTKVQ